MDFISSLKEPLFLQRNRNDHASLCMFLKENKSFCLYFSNKCTAAAVQIKEKKNILLSSLNTTLKITSSLYTLPWAYLTAVSMMPLFLSNVVTMMLFFRFK